MESVARIDEKKPHVVFIPFPAQSHIKCMLKLAKILHHKGIFITFINTQTNHTRLLKYGGFHVHDLHGFQFKSVPDGVDDDQPSQTIEQLSRYLATNFLDPFLDLVSGLETPVTCIISDGFMTFVKTPLAAQKLRVPIILFWTMAACGFMGFYHSKLLMEKQLVPLKESYLEHGDLDTLVDIPGMKEIRFRDLPEHVWGVGPKSLILKFIVELAHEADKVPHMIIHTFDELEASLINEIKSVFPHVYTVGPLQLVLDQITEKETFNGYSLWKEETDCFRWLQSKEQNSVVYVNFGSLAVMSLHDLVEFGWGLVNSNHYFLWIIRSDLVDGGSAVLPAELVEAIKKKGFIGNWCSQEEVLNHPSIGGFLTHGGWGSVIESLSAGVPMICCPFSGDQRTNCRQMCKDWEVGLEMGRNVKRDEVENVVRELMEGGRTRNKAMEWRKMAEIATGPGGSSFLNIEELVKEISMLSTN